MWPHHDRKLGFSVYIKIAQTSRYYIPTLYSSHTSWQSPLLQPYYGNITTPPGWDDRCVVTLVYRWKNRNCQLRCTCRTLTGNAFLPSTCSTHQPAKQKWLSLVLNSYLFIHFPSFFVCSSLVLYLHLCLSFYSL